MKTKLDRIKSPEEMTKKELKSWDKFAFKKFYCLLGLAWIVVIVIFIINSQFKFLYSEIEATHLNLISHQKSINLPIADKGQTTIASWYSWDYCLGCNAERIMANGEVLNDKLFTCAFNYAPLGTLLRVRHENKEIICEVTDRIGINTRIDLTEAAFSELSPLDKGLINVEIMQ